MKKRRTETPILLVHDQPEEKLVQDLSKPGYRLVFVRSAVEAFRRMLEERFELIIMALLPAQNVLTLIQGWAKLNDIPIVYLPSQA